MKRSTKPTKAIRRPVTLDQARILGKAHRREILRALADSPKGLFYSQLAFNVVKTSGTNLDLDELVAAGLVTHARRGDPYVITASGLKALELLDAIISLETPRATGEQVS